MGGHPVGHRFRPGEQPGQSVRSVLGLHHQIDGGQLGRRLRAGDHHHLGGPGERRGHTHGAGYLALGLGHVTVARTDDHVHRRDRLGAVGHGRDGLGPTHPVDLVDAGHRRRRQCGVVDSTVGPGRHAQDDLVHAGHLGGDGTHQYGRWIAGPPPGGIATGPGHWANQMPHADAARLEVIGAGVAGLMGVIGEDPVVGDVQRVLQLGRHASEGGADLAPWAPADPRWPRRRIAGSDGAPPRPLRCGPRR